ncbi:MAG TPA: helix-turn-helix domain-containing protein [Firmicutes bacterium]|nr:helix-turn-helix domain-containing protein [Bacillota bacterium]
MYKLKAEDGTNNCCGKNLRRIRKSQKPPLSQRKLAQKLQLMGYDLDNHFIRRIENGQRFVTDIEIRILAEFFHVSYEELLDGTSEKSEEQE